MPLSPQERRRYERQIALPGFGEAGQEKLRASKVLIVGAGGLGSAAGYYLAAAGAGTIGLLDGDAVEPSNLQRQVLHFTEDLGRLKVDSASEKLRALNPNVEVREMPERLSAASAPVILANYDFVLDCTDSFASKYLIADACAAAGKPYSHAGIHRFEGQTMTVIPGKTACLRCLLPEAPEDVPDPTRGPLGAIPGVIGTIQATEAIKYIVGLGRLLTDRLLVYDALEMRFRTIALRRVPGCPGCRRGC